jgi:hypothetical protein
VTGDEVYHSACSPEVKIVALSRGLWAVTPCSDVVGHRPCGGPRCLHLQELFFNCAYTPS